MFNFVFWGMSNVMLFVLMAIFLGVALFAVWILISLPDVTLRRGKDSDYIPEIHVGVGERIRDVMSSKAMTELLSKPYIPSPTFRVGAAQLFIAEIHVPGVKTVFDREIITLRDGGQIAVDWATSLREHEQKPKSVLPGKKKGKGAKTKTKTKAKSKKNDHPNDVCRRRRSTSRTSDPHDVEDDLQEHEDAARISSCSNSSCSDTESFGGPRRAHLPDDAPIVIVLHGIAGGSNDWKSLCARLDSEGYRAGVYVRRGHHGLRLSTPRLTAVGDPSDLGELLEICKSRYPRAKRFAVGFSAGGAILSNYASRSAERTLLDAAMVVSPGFDMKEAIRRMPAMYQRLITLNLSRVVINNRDILGKADVGVLDALGSSTITDFNNRVYRPLYGENLENPCDRIVSDDFDPGVKAEDAKCPVVFVSARDDPVCIAELIPYKRIRASPSAAIVITEWGSHCRFFRNLNEEPFINDLIVAYLDGCHDHPETDYMLKKNKKKTTNGWIQNYHYLEKDDLKRNHNTSSANTVASAKKRAPSNEKPWARARARSSSRGAAKKKK